MKKVFSKFGVIIVTAALLIGAFIVNMNANTDQEAKQVSAEGSTAASESLMQQGLIGETDQAEATEKNYFEAFREERSATRALEMEYLEEVIETAGSDAETLADAQQQRLALVENMEKEFTIESLIKAKGFNDAAVTFHSGSVNVIVDCENLEESQTAQILDIVMRETGESANNIKIQIGK